MQLAIRKIIMRVLGLSDNESEPFPDSLQISIDHWVNTKARGKLKDIKWLEEYYKKPEFKKTDKKGLPSEEDLIEKLKNNLKKRE